MDEKIPVVPDPETVRIPLVPTIPVPIPIPMPLPKHTKSNDYGRKSKRK